MEQEQSKIIDKAIASKGVNMPDIQTLTLRAQDLSQSVDWWNTAMIVGLVFAALAAVPVVITTHMALKRAKELSDTQDQLIQAKDAQLKAELAKIKDPRTLSTEQQARISEQLKPFAGTEFDVALTIDPETQGLLLPIEQTLKAAGWREIDWKSGAPIAEMSFTRKDMPNVGVVVVSGVIVQMHPEQLQTIGRAAQTLAAGLVSEGIEARAEPGVGVPNINAKAIHILIGKKPL